MAELKKGVYRELVRTDKHGNKIFRTNACKRCGGEGRVFTTTLDGGRCWGCGGTGMCAAYNTVEYTPEQSRLRRMKATAKRIGSVAEQLTAMGFNSDGIAYRPIGDTFSVKDRIRESGGRYTSQRGWIVPESLDFIECERLTASEFTTMIEHVLADKDGNELFKYVSVQWK